MLKKSNLRSLVILLLILISITGFSNLLSVNAGPYVPLSHPKNGWHWGVDVGDELYYEVEFVITNATSGKISQMFKDIWIYNITSIENVTRDWHGINDFSEVNASQGYYNVTKDIIEPYGESSEFALFGYDDSDTIKHKYRAGHNGMAFILPLNGSNNLQVEILDDILNESFYYPLGQSIYNQFDYYDSNPIINRIYFSNSTDDFFSEGYYYDNGTLEYGIAYMMVNMGGGDVYINSTIKRVFDYDITDEIQWSVNVGDDIFYTFYDGPDWVETAIELKLHITDISNIILEKTNNGFSNSTINMVYQAVFADIFEWNGSEFILVESNEPIGIANNFYPQYFDAMGPMLTFLYPINLQRMDFEFMWNNDTLGIWGIPFDEIHYYENGYLRTYLKNSTSSNFADVIVDKFTGLIESFLTSDQYNTIYYELKSQTLIEWSLDIGDIFYYKSNEDYPKDYRVTVTDLNVVYVNMTRLAEEYDSIGVVMPLPSDQPRLQFFSYLEADYEVWDPSTETWSISMGSGIISIANIFWPISPLVFDTAGPPLLVPENTQPSDMADLFVMFDSIYDEITYTADTVILTNTTEDKTLYYHFDVLTGRNIMMHGWANAPIPGSDWNFISTYTKKVESLATGNNQFTLQSDFTLDISVSIDLDVLAGPTPQYIYSVIPFNPVNITLPNGTALIFFDQLITNYGQIDGNITFTIIFPSNIDLSQTKLYFFAYNTSGTEQWDQPPSDFYDNILYNYNTNSITFTIESWGPRAMISAFGYIDLSQVPAIPGYDPLIIFGISIISILGIVYILRNKKNI